LVGEPDVYRRIASFQQPPNQSLGSEALELIDANPVGNFTVEALGKRNAATAFVRK
jgi:hypothetical protein